MSTVRQLKPLPTSKVEITFLQTLRVVFSFEKSKYKRAGGGKDLLKKPFVVGKSSSEKQQQVYKTNGFQKGFSALENLVYQHLF